MSWGWEGRAMWHGDGDPDELVGYRYLPQRDIGTQAAAGEPGLQDSGGPAVVDCPNEGCDGTLLVEALWVDTGCDMCGSSVTFAKFPETG